MSGSNDEDTAMEEDDDDRLDDCAAWQWDMYGLMAVGKRRCGLDVGGAVAGKWAWWWQEMTSKELRESGNIWWETQEDDSWEYLWASPPW